MVETERRMKRGLRAGLAIVAAGTLGGAIYLGFEPPVARGSWGSEPALVFDPPARPFETPEETVEFFAEEMAFGRLDLLWDYVPGSFRRDLTRFVHRLPGQIDEGQWERFMRTVARTGTFLRDQEDLITIFLNRMMHVSDLADGGVLFEDVRDHRDVVRYAGAVLSHVATSDLADFERIHELDVGAFLDELCTLAPYPESLNEFAMARLDAFEVARVGEDAGSVDLRILLAEGEPSTVTFVRFEGCWVPAEFAAGFSAEFASLLESPMSTRPPVSPAFDARLEAWNEGLDRLEAAETNAEFGLAAMGLFRSLADAR